MPKLSRAERERILSRYQNCPLKEVMNADQRLNTLGSYFSAFHSLISTNEIYWFRGHANQSWRLAPSALRYETEEQRGKAMEALEEMKRLLEQRIPRPPARDQHLKWMQIGQHHGLPTRLLDWTQNAAVALYFACNGHPDQDGLVVVLKPIELNQRVDPLSPRLFNEDRDADRLAKYFTLDGRVDKKGLPTIAVTPTWVTERILLQQGYFTLHGSRHFEMDRSQASSLFCVPILKDDKRDMLKELERVGVGEMFIFPEPEHVCSHIKRRFGL